MMRKSLRKNNNNVYLNSVNNGLLGGNNLVYSHLFNKERLYSSKVNKSKKIWIESEVFVNEDLDTFSKRIIHSLKIEKNREYSILLKIKKGDIYLMIADKQQHFKYDSITDLCFEKLFNNIIDFIYNAFQEYPKELEYSFENLLLEFFEVEIDNNLKISNIEPLSRDSGLNKNEIVSIKREFDIFGPMLKLHGVQLDINFNNNGMMEIFSDILNTNVNLTDFVEVFNKEVKKNNKWFIGFSNEKCEIFSIKIHANKQYIIICNKINNDLIEKSCYNMYGSFINKVKDSYKSLDVVGGGEFIYKRESKNKIYYFNSSNEVVRVERKITFDSISSDFRKISGKNESKNWIPNTNIGVLDLEAYTDDNSLAKCYAIGFLTNKDSSCKTFYINKDLDSVEIIHRCVNEMLKPKYKDIIFYVHNLGRYDSAFLLKSLILYNNTKEGKQSPYTLEPITRNSDIIKLVIKRNIDGKIRRVKIHDSATILTNNLRDLCEAYGVEIGKSFFPYEFCNKDTLFYIGSTPDIKFYNNIPYEEYKSLYKEVWSLHDECLIYLEKDLLSLYEVLDKVNKGMFLLFKKQMTNSLTISGFSSRLFLEQFYKKDKSPLPLILNRSVWLDTHKAYFGGRNEVLNPIVKDKIVYYYDVNSLYPYAMLNPMSGLNWVYFECISTKLELNKIELNENLFGWFYCKVKTTNSYLGLLPYRSPEGNLIFPVGTWYGWYFSEELKFAQDKGYELEIIKGYKTDKSYGAFDQYVKEVYKVKANPKNKVERNIAKLILNSGIGRYGMDYLKPVTKLLNKEKHNIVLGSRVLKNSLEIDENTYLDTFLPGVNKEVCKENGIDHTKVLNLENFDEKTNLGNYTSVSISTAAATLAYSRIHLARFLLYILEHGGNIYYTDTDSIITDLKLPEEFVSKNELGKLKLEHTIKEGYFVSDKTYCIVDIDGKITKRAKGVKSDFLTLEDYRKMYEMETVKAVKVSSCRDYTEGSVVIKTKEDVKLNPSHYSKRIRVYDKNNKWVGTKPVYIDINSPEE